jgi:hypothetical protein
MRLGNSRNLVGIGVCALIATACVQDQLVAQEQGALLNESCSEVTKAASTVVPDGENVLGVAILTSQGMRFCHSNEMIVAGSERIPAGACSGDNSACTLPPSALGDAQSITMQWGVVKEVPPAFCDESHPPKDGGPCTWAGPEAAKSDPAPLVLSAQPMMKAGSKTTARASGTATGCPPGTTLHLVFVGGSWVAMCIPNL